MSRYGIDYYGLSYYGSDNATNYSVAPFTATPTNYGTITLNWSDPNGGWTQLTLVRNSYGFPIDPWDGNQLLNIYNNGSDPGVYFDSNLVEGRFYYYSIFLFNTDQYNWVNAGNVVALSVKNFNATDNMYNYLPEIYKISQPYPASTDWDNQTLYGFLANFGFQLDYTQSFIESLSNRYNTEITSGTLIPTMMNQFGCTYESAIGLKQNRILLRDSIRLNQMRGSKEGLVSYLKDFSGWSVPGSSSAPNQNVQGVVSGHNLMLDYNDSSFEEGLGHWHISNTSTNLAQISTLSIYAVSLTSNVGSVYVNPNVQYQVGDQILISGLAYPLFNYSTPLTITAVGNVSGSTHNDYTGKDTYYDYTKISFALTGTDLPMSSSYNPITSSYSGVLTPVPAPWSEPTAPSMFPNKTNGLAVLSNTNTTAQTIGISCGDFSAGYANPYQVDIGYGIPVFAGTYYTFSVYASKGATTARNVTASIKWFDRFGNLISTSNGTAVSDNTTTFSNSVRPYVTDAAPSNAAYAYPAISVASVGAASTNERHYFDCAQFEITSSGATPTAFDEARQLHITLKANRINELTNPNFTLGASPWTAVGTGSVSSDSTYASPTAVTYTITNTSITSNVATVTLALPHSLKVGSTVYISNLAGTGITSANYNGARTITSVSLKTFRFAVTATDQAAIAPTTGTAYAQSTNLKLTSSGSSVTLKSWDGTTTSEMCNIYYPETSYTFSIYVQPNSTTETVTATINWYDLGYNLLSSSLGTAVTATSGSWSRPYVTATAPNNAAYATVELDWSTAASGDILYIDQALFENNGLLLDYFDGSGSDGLSYLNFFWEGGLSYANQARSHYYSNRVNVQSRLVSGVIQKQINLGSTYALYLAQPGT